MANKLRTISFHGIPKSSRRWLLITILVSLGLHLFSYVNLERFGGGLDRSRISGKAKSTVKFKVVEKPKKKESIKEDEVQAKRIIEAKMEPTEKPKEAKFQGAQDHIAQKEMKTNTRSTLNNQDAGLGGVDAATKKAQVSQKGQNQSKEPGKALKEMPENKTETKQLLGDGPVTVQKKSKYQGLLPSSSDLASQVQAGYQDYVDDEVEIGERVDFNTSSFRYIGYFTNLRKGFSQTWIYPSEAVRRGLQGQVRIEFTINRDGKLNRVKILETSGYKILDDAVVDAIKLSSPFQPLPEDHIKDRLTVVASFVYTLQGYAF